MSGRKNTVWLKTMIAKHGSVEAVRAYMAKNGSKGGKLSTGGGFASYYPGKDGLTGHERAIAAGTLGGSISRRKKKVIL